MLTHNMRRGALVISVVGLMLLAFFVGTAITTGIAADSSNVRLDSSLFTAQQPIDLSQLGLTPQEEELARLYERVSPSVVSISVVARRGTSTSFFPDEDGFSFGSGSGFVIDQQGHIVTNNHVVDGATRIEVNFFDGTIVRGEIVGLDPASDLALLRVDLPPENLFPVTIADSDSLVIGQTAIAIGSPFGQRWTLTTGIISALDRTIRGLTQFSIGAVIQTDAAINPGNSGGPLLNLRGEVIGVNSQIISRSQSNSGVGFAVPSNLVRRVIDELVSDGFVDYSYMGIGGDDISLTIIEAFGLPNNMRGVVVGSVAPGGPAENAGLRIPGETRTVNGLPVPSSADIILEMNGEPVTG